MEEDDRLLESVSARFGLSASVVRRLMEVERKMEGRLRRRGIVQQMRDVIEETSLEDDSALDRDIEL